MIRRRQIAAVLLLMALRAAVAQIEVDVQTGIAVQPFLTAHSIIFHAEAGDIVVVRPQGDPNLDIEVSVYKATRELAAKEDPDVHRSAFEWIAPEDGDYYVLARNLTGVSGTLNVAIRRGAKAGALPAANYAIVRVFYATNRQQVGDGTTAPYFDARKTVPDYTVGTAFVTIPRAHRIGELESAAIYRLDASDKSKYIVLAKVAPDSNRDHFLKELGDQVRKTERREALVFIHGFNVSFQDAARRTAQICYDLGFAGAALMFTWPSEDAKVPTPGDYQEATRNVVTAHPQLKAFLHELARESGATTIHLVAHSMGNQVLANALKGISEEKRADMPRFREVVLMAPDIDAGVFRSLTSAMRTAADRVTLYASSRDKALIVSERLNHGLRAGQSGANLIITPGIDTVDASAVKTDAFAFDHSYYADNIVVLSDLYHLFRGDPPETRFGLERVEIDRGIYWRFRPYVR